MPGGSLVACLFDYHIITEGDIQNGERFTALSPRQIIHYDLKALYVK